MYRRSKSLEVLLDVRQQMAREADFDVDLFVEMVRSGSFVSDHEPVSIDAEAREEGSENKAA